MGYAPGTSVEAKTAALAQAGISAIGQFKHVSDRHKVRSIATVILYKDLSAHVALATLDPAKACGNMQHCNV